ALISDEDVGKHFERYEPIFHEVIARLLQGMQQIIPAGANEIIFTTFSQLVQMAFEAGLKRAMVVLATRPITFAQAREIARDAAKANPPSYYTGDDFEPHPWVIAAIMKARAA